MEGGCNATCVLGTNEWRAGFGRVGTKRARLGKHVGQLTPPVGAALDPALLGWSVLAPATGHLGRGYFASASKEALHTQLWP